MAVRNCRFELRLSQEELNDLTEKADRAGISKADFVRKTIKGKTIKEAPPVDVPLLIREVRRVGKESFSLVDSSTTRQDEKKKVYRTAVAIIGA